MSDTEKTTASASFVRVVRGNPTPQQVAALTAVLAAKSAASGGPTNTIGNDWGRPVDRLRPNWASPTSHYRQLW